VRSIIRVKSVDMADLKSLGAKECVMRFDDTLCGVARKFYGNPDEWPVIQRLNPDLPSDPTRIRTGTCIRIFPLVSKKGAAVPQ
jgi:hypothetical protein